jgi:hypothetical protein
VQCSATSHDPAAERHTVVDGAFKSPGHEPAVPEQTSATSQAPAAERHTVPADANASTQVLSVPLQWSAASHGPLFDVPVHDTVTAATPSAGQAAELPVHRSATSHGPVAARHTVVLAWKPSAGHAPDVPVHASATSQMPAEDRHTVPAALNVSTHVLSVPLQWSAASHGPLFEAPLQLVVAGCTLSMQTPDPLQVFWASHCPLELPPHVVPATRFVHPNRFTSDWHDWQSFTGLRAPLS